LCGSDGRYQFNTQVAFDAKGRLVAKYHKAHLFGGAGVFDQVRTD
jgi:predicted amidohydrolase